MLSVGVVELHHKVPGGEPPNNDGLLNEEGKLMYEYRGDSSISGELFNELRKRVAGNIFHVVSEQFILDPSTSEPFVQLKM